MFQKVANLAQPMFAKNFRLGDERNEQITTKFYPQVVQVLITLVGWVGVAVECYCKERIPEWSLHPDESFVEHGFQIFTPTPIES